MDDDDAGATSQDGRDEEDEEDYEEGDGGNRLLGFMFGNVDDSGDLDVDYLDEDAKEHLAALADKLGPSLTDIDLRKSSPAATDEVDYDEKAEDAIDYEDIDEQYDGPEIQEEDHLLPKEDFISSATLLASLDQKASVFDEENYDEDEEDIKDNEAIDRNVEISSFPSAACDELKKENEEMEINIEVSNIPSGDCEEITKEYAAMGNNVEIPSFPSAEMTKENEAVEINVEVQSFPSEGEQLEKCSVPPTSPNGCLSSGSQEEDDMSFEFDDFQEESNIEQEQTNSKSDTSLPVLCIENGMVVLKFSEIFGIHEPLKKAKKKDPQKHFTSKERLKVEDADIEEDEELFLRSSCYDPSMIKYPNSLVNEVEVDFQNANFNVDEQIKNSCLSAQPMKDDSFLADVSSCQLSIPTPDIYPLDQQDWENAIIWGNSPTNCNVWSENCVLSELEDEGNPEVELEDRHAHENAELDSKDHSLLIDPVIVEPFGARNLSYSASHSSYSNYHPQLLRLESIQTDNDVCSLDKGNGKVHKEDTMHRFHKLSLQNKDLLNGSWLDRVMWDPDEAIPKPKLILDLQDEQMLFEISDEDSEHLCSHARAMVMMRSSNSYSGDSCDLHNQGVRFNISNDKHYSSRKISQQAKSHAKKRSVHGIKVLHSAPALKLQTMKPKLNYKDISNFHRPKALWYPHDNEAVAKAQGTLCTTGPMNIILTTLGGGTEKAFKIDINAEEPASAVISRVSKKLDLRPSEKVKVIYSGKELKDDESLGLQNVCPNSMLHLVRTKINVWRRAQKLPGENKSLRPPGAFKKKTDLSVKDGHVFLLEYCEERPLLLGNAGMGARLCTYYQKIAPNDQTASSLRNGNDGLGTVLSLEPSDKSPFLGDIRPGCSQSCLETNMYRAPVFPHKSSTVDYLLVRSAKGMLSLRRIDKLYSVGQQEPHMEVLSPTPKTVQTYLVNRMLVYIYRAFRAMDKPNIIPTIRVDDLAALFPGLTDAIVRKRLKHCADIRRGRDGIIVWVKRHDFRIPNEEEIRGILTPENVCCYESMQAGLYRLKRLGISKLLTPSGLSSAMNQLPDEAIALAAASHIERELQITPWNLTSNFVACTTQNRENIEKLEITGVGDPSGRGLGFSYVRVSPKASISNAISKKKAAPTKVSSTVTGTDADLRRLSMEAAREVLTKFNVPQEQINKLTRWHRIALVRKLSSEQAAAGAAGVQVDINKFARGQKMPFLQLQQQAREKCQEIWDRQIQSLSATNGDEIDSDSEANSDLDSFAGDLENLLDAEEFDEEDGNVVSKGDKTDVVRGRKMRRCNSQTQTEEEIEDDEADAVFLLRLLEDDEVELKKKKKFMKEIGHNSQPVSDHVQSFVKTNQNFNIAHSEGLFTPKETKINESKEAKVLQVENFLLERNFSEKFKINKVSKEKREVVRSCRDSFVCGACGQHGHMRTNKNCPKYGEDPETSEFETFSAKSYNPDTGSQLKIAVKKMIPKMSAKVIEPEVSESAGLKSNSKLKFKCGSSEKVCEKNIPSTQGFDKQTVASTEVKSNKPIKISKIILSNKMKTDDAQYETSKPSPVIRPFSDVEKDQPLKKIIIKQPKTINDMSPVSEAFDMGMGYEYKKTKKITELSIEKQKKNESIWYSEEDDILGEAIYESRYDEERRRNKHRFVEEHHSLFEASSSRYGELMWSEDKKSSKKKKKKKKKKKPDFRDEYLLDHKPYRNERRVIPERDRASKRRPIIDSGLDYAPPSKRRRGAEVMLSNILETIVDSLRDSMEISYLFLKPVTRKEAPDYLDIVQRPMDLSTIRDKVRSMDYRSREEFRHDVWQITYNAHIYNDGRNPGIPPLADQLLELCDYHLQEKDYALTEAESAIEREL